MTECHLLEVLLVYPGNPICSELEGNGAKGFTYAYISGASWAP